MPSEFERLIQASAKVSVEPVAHRAGRNVERRFLDITGVHGDTKWQEREPIQPPLPVPIVEGIVLPIRRARRRHRLERTESEFSALDPGTAAVEEVFVGRELCQFIAQDLRIAELRAYVVHQQPPALHSAMSEQQRSNRTPQSLVFLWSS